MKFLCDRCKTRYSIADDRVRGKILKIRCKSCAHVITVREGMTADPDAAAGDPAARARKPTAGPPDGLDERAPGRDGGANRPGATRDPLAAGRAPGKEAAGAPLAGSSRGTGAREAVAARDPIAAALTKRSTEADTARALGRGNARTAAAQRGESSNALNAAFASAMAQPAPAALEEEWYVSIDGEQAGPFSLADAQRWVTEQPFDAELHCWSEGFDDWLPVDKVSHFRGLRKRPTAASAPPPLPRVAAPRTSIAAPAAVEDEPKPLFAATMAALERGAPAIPASGLGLPPPIAPSAAPSAAPSVAPSAAPPARATPPKGAPIAARGGPGDRAVNGAPGAVGPARDAAGRSGALADARPESRIDGKPGAKLDGRPGAKLDPRASAPARLPLADPFDGGEGDGGETQLEAMPFDDAPVEPARPAPASGAGGAGLDAGPGGSAAALTAPRIAASSTLPGTGANPATTAAPASGDFGGDDLDIGEVSRVVNLADIARNTRSTDRSLARRTGAAQALTTRSTGLEPSVRPSFRQTGAAASLSPAEGSPEDGDPGQAIAPAVRAHRRGLIALLAVAAVMVLGVIGAVVVFVTRDDDATGGSLGPVHDIDTSRPDGPISHRPAVPAVPAPVVPRPTQHIRPSTAGPTTEAPAPGGTLASEEIEDVARRHQDMTQRCYMRSQRGADAILIGDVKKIAVTLTIDREGNVSDLRLSDHAADNLGKCLTGAIRAWKFRQSAGGTFRFSLNFVNG